MMKETIIGIAVAGALVTYKVLLYVSIQKEIEKEKKKKVVDLKKVKTHKEYL